MADLVEGRKHIVTKDKTIVTVVTFLSSEQEVNKAILSYAKSQGWEIPDHTEILGIDDLMAIFPLFWSDYIEETFEFTETRLKKLINVILKMKELDCNEEKICNRIIGQLKHSKNNK